MSAALRTIHVARRELGLDDLSYRAMLHAVTGKGSAADMTEAERQAVIERMTALGFKRVSSRRKTTRAPHVRLIYALWGDLQSLGAVKAGAAGAPALRGFVKRQTGTHAPEFLTAQDAASVTEALKAWIKRTKGQSHAAQT